MLVKVTSLKEESGKSIWMTALGENSCRGLGVPIQWRCLTTLFTAPGSTFCRLMKPGGFLPKNNMTHPQVP